MPRIYHTGDGGYWLLALGFGLTCDLRLLYLPSPTYCILEDILSPSLTGHYRSENDPSGAGGNALFNTQSGRIERFTPRDGTVGLYVCGVTPYDTTHIGHAFTFLTFDILVRFMRYKGWDVTYVQNVTDIDDDILRKAKQVGLTWKDLGDREIARYLKDMRDLNALAPDHYVRATDHIPEMLEITQSLIDKGFAYQSGGSVYFSVDSDSEFGKLSHIPRNEMLPIANERGNTPDDPNKRDPLDFVLWQKPFADEQAWDSPYGPGRPGWHV